MRHAACDFTRIPNGRLAMPSKCECSPRPKMSSFKRGLIMAALAGFVCGLAIRACAGSAEQVSLADAVAIARAHNPDLAAVAQELGIAEGQLNKARYLSQSN